MHVRKNAWVVASMVVGSLAVGCVTQPVGPSDGLVNETFDTPPTVTYVPMANVQVNVLVSSNDPNSELKLTVRNSLGTEIASTPDGTLDPALTPTASLTYNPSSSNLQQLRVQDFGTPRAGALYTVLVTQ